MREEFVFTWKKWNAESKGQTFFLLTFQFSLFSSLSPFFSCVCAQVVHIWLLLCILEHMWEVLSYMCHMYSYTGTNWMGIFLHDSPPLFVELRSLRQSQHLPTQILRQTNFLPGSPALPSHPTLELYVNSPNSIHSIF